MVFPSVKTVAGMLSTGLGTLAGWLFGSLSTLAERLGFLSVRYPEAPWSEIQAGLAVAESAWQAGQQFEAGLGMPPLEEIPTNPNIQTTNTISVDVVIEVPNPSDPERPTTRHTVVEVPDDLDEADIAQAIADQVKGEIGDTVAMYSLDEEEYDIDSEGNVVYIFHILGFTRSNDEG